MKIIIAGAGKIGSSIARQLNSEGHDLTLIDSNREAISKISDELDVICLEGNATNSDVLREAGADSADLVVAATEKDEINMICGISARKLGTDNVIARIRDPEYLNKTEFLREAFGLNMIVNPEYECAKEISRILRFPGTARLDAFSKGSVEIAGMKVEKGDKLDGKQLKELSLSFGARVLVSIVERDGEAHIPNGNFKLAEGDKLSVTGTAKELRKFFIATGYYKKPVKTVMIMGGGRISLYLARILNEVGIQVTIIDKDREQCEKLTELMPEARVIYGDATQSEVLYEEGINSTDAFVALSGDDGNNIITSMFVKNCPVDKIITKVSHSQYPEVIKASGLDTIVSPQSIVAQQLARYVRAMSNSADGSMETLYKLADEKAEAIEFIIGEDAKVNGKPLKELGLKQNTLIAAVIRGKTIIMPNGETVLQPGDHAVICAKAGVIKGIDDILV